MPGSIELTFVMVGAVSGWHLSVSSVYREVNMAAEADVVFGRRTTGRGVLQVDD